MVQVGAVGFFPSVPALVEETEAAVTLVGVPGSEISVVLGFPAGLIEVTDSGLWELSSPDS